MLLERATSPRQSVSMAPVAEQESWKRETGDCLPFIVAGSCPTSPDGMWKRSPDAGWSLKAGFAGWTLVVNHLQSTSKQLQARTAPLPATHGRNEPYLEPKSRLNLSTFGAQVTARAPKQKNKKKLHRVLAQSSAGDAPADLRPHRWLRSTTNGRRCLL